MPGYRAAVLYERALAYLVGLEGVVLPCAFTGEFDRQFVEARLAEVRELLDDESLNGQGVVVDRVDTVDGYRVWSQPYDEPLNELFDPEGSLVHEPSSSRNGHTAIELRPHRLEARVAEVPAVGLTGHREPVGAHSVGAVEFGHRGRRVVGG